MNYDPSEMPDDEHLEDALLAAAGYVSPQEQSERNDILLALIEAEDLLTIATILQIYDELEGSPEERLAAAYYELMNKNGDDS